MLNPDRTEFRSQPAPASENRRKNRYIPLWVRTPALALRTSLAILTVTPGAVIATNLINHPYRNVEDTTTVNSQYNLDSPQIYKLHLNAEGFVIRGFRDEANFEKDFLHKDFPVDKARIINNGGNTGIKVKAEQTIEFSASGKVDFAPYIYNGEDPYRWSKNCTEAPVFNPDGYHIWSDNTTCLGNAQKEIPQGMLLGFLYYNGNPSGLDWYSPTIQIGSHWKGIMDNRKKQEDLDGGLHLKIKEGYGIGAQHGGYDVTVTVYPLEPKVLPTVSAVAPSTPRKIETDVSSQKDTGLPGWLWGLGASLLAGLALREFLRRGTKTTVAGSVSATGTGTSFSTGVSSLPGGISGVLGGSSNPNTAPNFGSTHQKNPEWITGQQEFERRWQVAKSKLSPVRSGDTGNEPEYVLERFKSAAGIVHEFP